MSAQKVKTAERKSGELKVGDVLWTKYGPPMRLTVVDIGAGMAGGATPYLVFRNEDGGKLEHDTSWDSRSATYTVEVPPN